MLVFLECRLFFVIFVPFDMFYFTRQQIRRKINFSGEAKHGNGRLEIPHVKNRRYIDLKRSRVSGRPF